MATMCPGIKVKNFDYLNNFIIYMKIFPNAFHLITDEPIALGTQNILPDSNGVILQGTPLSNNETLLNALDLKKNIADKIDEIKKNINDLVKNIDDSLKNPSNEVDCSSVNPGDLTDESKTKQTTIKVKNSQGEVIKEETINITETPIAKCNQDNLYHAIKSFDLPKNIDPFKQKQDDPFANLCELPSDNIKSVLKYVKDDLNNDINNMNKNFDLEDYDKKLKNIFKNITGLSNAPQTEDDFKNYYEKIKQDNDTSNLLKLDFKLGIPCAQFDNHKKIIMQINKQKLEVINLYDSSGKYLHIDKEIPLNKFCEIAFKTDGFRHQLFLKIEGDDTIYHDEIIVPKNLTISYIGIDDEANKSFCGLITDIRIFTGAKADLQNIFKDKYKFEVPYGALYYYDWHKNRIKYNLVFPLPKLKPPVKMNSSSGIYKIYKRNDTDYWFMHDTFLTEFFCYKQFRPKEWSINFWLYIEDLNKLKNDTGFNSFRTIINDFKNKQALEYDANSLNFKLKIQGQEYLVPYLLNEKTWYYIILKYKDKQLQLKIKSIFDNENNKEFFTSVITLKKDLEEFIIHSMLAAFDGKFFTKQFFCKFGTLALFDKFNNETVDYDIYKKEKEIINFYKL